MGVPRGSRLVLAVACVIAGAAGFGVAVRTVSGTPAAGPAGRVAAVEQQPAEPGPRVPGVLEIPSLGVSAPMIRVGLDDNREMVVPDNALDVGWLDNGSFPGPTGNAILAGHHDFKGVIGSLAGIGRLQHGSIVTVAVDGRLHTYAVRWIQVVDRDTQDTEHILGATDTPSITLITCTGRFDKQTGHYEKRVIVRAEAVSTAAA